MYIFLSLSLARDSFLLMLVSFPLRGINNSSYFLCERAAACKTAAAAAASRPGPSTVVKIAWEGGGVGAFTSTLKCASVCLPRSAYTTAAAAAGAAAPLPPREASFRMLCCCLSFSFLQYLYNEGREREREREREKNSINDKDRRET
jgi:hypothetical protein